MKLTCPECASHFDIPTSLLGMGRRVRCNQCSHIWFQDPISEEPSAFGNFRSFEDDLRIEPIPASVHPHDHDDDSHAHGGPGFFASINWGYLARMILGFVLAAFMAFGAVYGLGAAGIRPAYLAPVQNFFGMHEKIVGAGLSLRDVKAGDTLDKEGSPVMAVSGRAFNTTKTVVLVPGLQITPISGDGVEGTSLRIKLDKDLLDPDQSVSFTAMLPGKAGPETRIRVRFVE